MKIHVLYHGLFAPLNVRLSEPLERLSNDDKLCISFHDLSRYCFTDLSEVDVLIFSNLIDKKALEIADEAGQRGICIIYDSAFGDDKDLDISDTYHHAFRDIRAHSLRDMILKKADKVTSADESIVSDHKHIRDVFTVIGNGDHKKWREVINSMTHSVQKQREETGNCKKRIYFVSPTLMWPHHYISDILVKNLMDMGHSVHLFTLKPTQFHREAICRFKDFDPEYVNRVLGYAEDLWKLPLLIDRDRPDLVLTVQGYMVPSQILVEIGRRKFRSAVWFMDEPYDSSRSSSYGRYFTHVFLQDSASVAYHRHHGNPESFYLPHGCDPAGIHSGGKDKDTVLNEVALVGTPFPARIALVKRMLEANIRVAVVGNGWKTFADGLPTGLRPMLSVNEGTVSLSNAAVFYRHSQININVHRSEDDFSTNPGSFRAMSPNCSMFYIPGSGGFQLADSGREETEDFFVPGKEIALFDSPDECVEQVRYYLKNDDKRMEIAEAGYKRALSEHTYAHRIDRMLKIIDETDELCFNPGHTRIGYLNLFANLPDSGSQPLEGGNLTVLVERRSARGLSERIKEVRTGPGAGFANAINTAILEIPSDFIVAGDMGVCQSGRVMEEIIKMFPADLYLGMVLLKDCKGERITGFVMPFRTIMDVGSFRYGDVTKSILDMRYRLEDMGMVVKEAPFDSQPIDGTPFSKELDDDRKMFLLEWTDDPESRIKAQRLLSVVFDNPGKVNKDDAKSISRKTLDICPSFKRGHRQLGDLLLKDGELYGARQHLKTAWELESDNFQSALLYAISLYMSSDFETAHFVLDGVLTGDSTPSQKATAWYQKGLIKKKEGRPEDAQNAFLEAIKLDPTHFNSMQELALIYLDKGKIEKALSMLLKKHHFKDDANTMNDIGVISWQFGKKEEAYEWLVRALKKDPSNRDAVMNIHSVGTDLGYQCKLREFIIAYLSFRPDDIEVAKLLQSLGR